MPEKPEDISFGRMILVGIVLFIATAIITTLISSLHTLNDLSAKVAGQQAVIADLEIKQAASTAKDGESVTDRALLHVNELHNEQEEESLRAAVDSAIEKAEGVRKESENQFKTISHVMNVEKENEAQRFCDLFVVVRKVGCPYNPKFFPNLFDTESE